MLLPHRGFFVFSMLFRSSWAFLPRPTRRPFQPVVSKDDHASVTHPHRSTAISDTSNSGLDELSEERKANLFQYLLRDLQVEGVPLLAVDASELEVFQVAMWTTLAAQLCQPEADKACMVLEEIPLDKLMEFVDDFATLKTEKRLISSVPELERVTLSLVGRGVGPAILMDVKAAEAEDPISPSTTHPDTAMDPALTASMKAFMDRIVAKTDPYPYKHDNLPTGYKICHQNDVPHILSSFWNAICELRTTDESNLGTSVLVLPGISTSIQFTVVSEIIGRSLALFGNDDAFTLMHYFPKYNRDDIHPKDEPALGHIPPLTWIHQSLAAAGGDDDSKLTKEEVALSNYQRRSPVTAVIIKRSSLVKRDERLTRNNPSSESNMEQGHEAARSHDGANAESYVEISKFLAAQGEMALQEAADREKSMAGI